jgi:hypothetical protein
MSKSLSTGRAVPTVDGPEPTDRTLTPNRNVPDVTPLARKVFDSDSDAALRVPVDYAETVTLLPWGTRDGGLVAFRSTARPGESWPVSVGADEARALANDDRAWRVDLVETPAWVLNDRRHPLRVSWHARVRYAERVERVAEPSYAIRKAWGAGVPVGVSAGRGYYHPPTGVVIVTRQRDVGVVAATIYAPATLADLATDHLPVCRSCLEPYHERLRRDGAACPWCGERSPSTVG